MSDFAEAEEILKKVVEKIGPAVLEMAARRDNGKIEIHFCAGDLKFAQKSCTL